MRKILMILVLIISIKSFGQNPTNYQYRVVYERLRGLMPDSVLHIPRYNGVPSGLRGGSSTHDGAIAFDTLNGHIYGYRNSAWFRLANYSDVTGLNQKFGHASGDFRAGENRYHSLAGTYTMSIDSASQMTFGFDGANGLTAYDYTTGNNMLRLNNVNGAQIFSPDNVNYAQARNDRVWFNISTGDSLGSTILPYNSGDRVVGLVQDTLTGRWYRKTAGAGDVYKVGTPVNNQVGVWTGDGTIEGDANLTWDGAELRVGGFADLTVTGNIYTPNGLIRGGWFEGIEAGSFGSVTSGMGVLWVKNDGTLHFKNDANVDIELGAGGGEANTASNVGSGAGVWKDKVGVDLRFKSLVAGDGIGITSNTNDLTIAATIGITNNDSWYQYYLTGTGGNASAAEVYYYFTTGTNASIANIQSSIPDGWMHGQRLTTGTTNAGHCYYYAAAVPGSSYGLISINSSKRYSWKQNVRFEDLSDGTETYAYYAGFVNDVTAFSSVTNGAGFRYAHTDSSGSWIAWTKAGGSLTEDAVGSAIAADTDYLLEVSIIGTVAYFYINKVLATSISTNVPNGSSQAPTTGAVFKKSAGTTARVAYIELMAFGKTSQ